MPYMMRMTNDGISIHGSDSVAPGYATHGCVAVPVAFAKKLFEAAKLGDLVIVTDGKRLQMGEAIVRTLSRRPFRASSGAGCLPRSK